MCIFGVCIYIYRSICVSMYLHIATSHVALHMVDAKDILQEAKTFLQELIVLSRAMFQCPRKKLSLF